MQKQYKQILSVLENCDPHDDIDKLERAMHMFCSQYDKGAGYRHAIEQTLIDQYNNHKEDLTVGELEHLLKILN